MNEWANEWELMQVKSAMNKVYFEWIFIHAISANVFP